MSRQNPPYSSIIYTKEKLDNFVMNIEFLLISVIQGVALAALAQKGADIIGTFEFQYFPYIISGFIIVILFWSQAIMHTISFIDWPLNMTHNFLYFLSAFAEVTAFSHMENPALWFLFSFLFMIVGLSLYIFDYIMIRNHKKDFDMNPSKRALYVHMEKRQRYELITIIPAGLIFNLVALIIISTYKESFIVDKYHVLLICFQVIANSFVMLSILKSFGERTKLITACIES